MGSKEQGSEKDQFIPMVRSSLSVFTVLSKPEAENAASQRPPPASGLGFSLGVRCGGPGPRAVRDGSGTGPGWQRAARPSAAAASLVQTPGTGQKVCAIFPGPPIRSLTQDQRNPPPVLLPINSSMPVHPSSSAGSPSSSALPVAIGCVARHGTVCLQRAHLFPLPPIASFANIRCYGDNSRKKIFLRIFQIF